MRSQPHLRRRIQSIETVRTSVVSAATSQRSLPRPAKSLGQSAIDVKLHFEPNKHIERSFKKFVQLQRTREQIFDGLKSTVSKIGRRLNDTEAMVKSAVVEHCQSNQALKDDQLLISSVAFSKSKTQENQQAFQQKLKQFRQSTRKRVNRDKLDEVISKSRERYQQSRNASGPFTINGLVKMFCEFEDICRRQRRPVQRRIMELQNISEGIGLSSSKETISIDDYLKNSRIIGGAISPSK